MYDKRVMTFEEILPSIIPNKTETLKRFSGNSELLETFVKKFPQNKTWLRFQEIADGDNWEEMEMVSHTLKGYVGNLGFQDLYEVCAELVKLVRGKQFDSAKELIPKVIATGRAIEKYIAQIQ